MLELFDGRSLDGWAMAGDGGFDVVAGTLESFGGMGLLWYTRRQFGDFTLELDWQVQREADNSGVFLRFPDPGDDPWVAVERGYEIQIDDLGAPDGAAVARTGAVYRLAAPSTVASRPPGQWNRYAIHVDGQRYRVTLNDVAVTDFEGDRGLRGHVGLQNHDGASRVRFRDIRVRPSGGGEAHGIG